MCIRDSDRPDLQFAAEELGRGTQRPTQRDLRALKRCARYLIGARHYGRRIELTVPGDEIEFIDAYGDAD
eukprot:9076279-Alexandrium_andersonii.AAC.1